MSRARKHETPAHRKERNRQRLRAAEKRRARSVERRARATGLYRAYLRSEGRRAIWWHIPRGWRRRLTTGRAL